MPSIRSFWRSSILGGLAAIIALTSPMIGPETVQAASLQPTPLTTDEKTLVDQAAAYLQGLGELKGRFEQIDARGTVTHGDLFLARPGRARFAYDPPSNLLLISNGHTVSVTDPRLKTVSRYPLAATPLSLFLAREVRFDRNITVTQVQTDSDGFTLTLRDIHHPGRGQVTLTFTTAPLRLAQWSMVDGQGRTTRIRLTELEAASGLSPTLFVTPEPLE